MCQTFANHKTKELAHSIKFQAQEQYNKPLPEGYTPVYFDTEKEYNDYVADKLENCGYKMLDVMILD